jgi:hypothetical protein
VSNALGSVAARQLLIHHRLDNEYTYLYKTQYNIDWTSMNEAFLNSLSTLGYPETTRNIALVNGTNLATDYIFAPHDLYYEDNIVKRKKWYFPETRFYTYAKMTPLNATMSEVSKARLKIGGVRYNQKIGYAYYTGSRFFDDCPGSYLDQFTNFANQKIKHFCFVPTVSAIDLSDDYYELDSGLYYFNKNIRTKDAIINNNSSPFDEIISNENNTIHAKIYEIEDVAGFIKRELMLDDFYLQDQTISSDTEYQANSSIVMGNNVNPYSTKTISTGNVFFEAGANVNITAPVIRLKAGTHIQSETMISANTPVSTKSSKLNLNKNCLQLITKSKDLNNKVIYKLSKDQYGGAITLPKWTIYGLNTRKISKGLYFEHPNYLKNGNYTLKVEFEDSTGIKLSSTKCIKLNNVISDVNINSEYDFQNSPNIYLYPNPTSGNFRITSTSNVVMQITIYDMMGSVLYINNHYNGDNIKATFINGGMFVVKITQNGVEYNRKLIIK